MNIDEFDKFLAENPKIEWNECTLEGEEIKTAEPNQGTHLVFRWPGSGMPHYENGGKTVIASERFRKMTPADLDRALKQGLRVEGITRVTGYFSKLSGWNSGKRAELKDRHRNEIE